MMPAKTGSPFICTWPFLLPIAHLVFVLFRALSSFFTLLSRTLDSTERVSNGRMCCLQFAWSRVQSDQSVKRLSCRRQEAGASTLRVQSRFHALWFTTVVIASLFQPSILQSDNFVSSCREIKILKELNSPYCIDFYNSYLKNGDLWVCGHLSP